MKKSPVPSKRRESGIGSRAARTPSEEDLARFGGHFETEGWGASSGLAGDWRLRTGDFLWLEA